MTHDELLNLLEGKYCAPYWWFLREVRNNTSFYADRTADGLAIGLYESKGQDLLGFEVKATRGDWITEMQKPEKAEAFMRYADYWYLVTNPGVVKPEEMPSSWGLMLPTKKGNLRAEKMPTRLKPKPISRGLFARILQQSIQLVAAKTEERLGVKDIEARIQRERADAQKQAEDRCKEQVEAAESRLKQMQERVRGFEEASGIRLGHYDGFAELGATLRAVRGGELGILQQLETIERTVGKAEAHLKELAAIKQGIAKLRERCP